MGDKNKDPDSLAAAGAMAVKSTMRSSERVPNALNIASPPGSRTPPSMPSKKTIFYPATSARKQKSHSSSEPVDPNLLAKALKEYEDAGRPRERTPGTSPSRKRQRVYGDR
jgi:cell division cycle 20-like protein 1 (cofactor of APC complex)